jgi:hypothetical protein
MWFLLRFHLLSIPYIILHNSIVLCVVS